MGLPTPEQRPDIYDYQDARPVSHYPTADDAEMREMMRAKFPKAYARAEARRKKLLLAAE